MLLHRLILVTAVFTFFLVPTGASGALVDSDGDGLTDDQEKLFGSNAADTDTDGDTYPDFDEVMYGYSPTDPAPVKKNRPMILIDLTSQRIQYIVADVIMHEAPVSTGYWRTATPVGRFSIERKVPVMRYTGATYDYKNVKWNLQFKPHYYLHTAYWHDDFGIKPRSRGCVNMREKDVEIIYKYAPIGTPVEVIGTTPRAPVSV